MVGLPLNSPFDEHFTLNTDDHTNGLYSFDGFTGSTISYDKNKRTWFLVLWKNPNISATLKLPHGKRDYPLGMQEWSMNFPSNSDQESFNETIVLNLNACDDNEDFTCHDGDCLDMEKR